MRCPNLEDHYVKINAVNGGSFVFRPCCLIPRNSMPIFTSYKQLRDSDWIRECRDQLKDGIWPVGCNRCKFDETVLDNIDGNKSLRQEMIQREETQTRPDYLHANITITNECNAACQICSPFLSTRIGRLTDKTVIPLSCVSEYKSLPLDRITEMTLTGGEVSFNKESKEIISNLPPNVKSLVLITNGSRKMTELLPLLDRNVDITLAMSIDGTGRVFEYSRWPLKWDTVSKTVKWYQTYGPKMQCSLNVTLSALNIIDIDNIIDFANSVGVSIKWSILTDPVALAVQGANTLTRAALKKHQNSPDATIRQIMENVATGPDNQQIFDQFVTKQDALRNINIKDFLDI